MRLYSLQHAAKGVTRYGDEKVMFLSSELAKIAMRLDCLGQHHAREIRLIFALAAEPHHGVRIVAPQTHAMTVAIQ